MKNYVRYQLALLDYRPPTNLKNKNLNEVKVPFDVSKQH